MPVQTLLATPIPEQTAITPNRADGQGGAWVLPVVGRDLGAVAEGSLFTAVTPTSGTGIIGHAAPTTFDQTKAYIYVYNGGTKTIYPQNLVLTETVASIGGTTGGLRIVPVLDIGNRFSSGGTALTIANNNSGSSVASGAVATCGAVVLTAGTASARNLGDIVFRQTLIDIIGDKFTISWGATSVMGNVASIVATLAEFSVIQPAIAISPGWALGLHIWRASMSTGPTLEIQMSWVER